MELVAVLVAGGLAIVLVHALRARAWREVVGDLDDGVPVAPIEVADDEIGHARDGSVVVRQTSSHVTSRIARGSTPPPIREPSRVASGELTIPPSPALRALTPHPSVDEGWDLSDLT